MAKEAVSRKQSIMSDKIYEVDGVNAIGNVPAPGVSEHNVVEFETLGQLMDVATDSQNHDDGEGEFVVVLSNFLSGASEDDHFSQGDVRRISRVVPGYSDPAVSRDVVRDRVRRLLSLKAIRLATPEEQSQSRIDVTVEGESASVQSERNKRIAVERENTLLRERLGIANGAYLDASNPGQAGASNAAQQAVNTENSDDINFDD